MGAFYLGLIYPSLHFPSIPQDPSISFHALAESFKFLTAKHGQNKASSKC